MDCRWVGPLQSDLNCSGCVLGYETASSTKNTSCVKPPFRPYRGWSANHSWLRLQDTLRGTAAVRNASTGVTVATLLTGHTYSIPAPQLEPKERHYVGYKPPHTQIFYELDFSRGAEVDIGCGTTVVGDSTLDGMVSKNKTKHPLSMQRFSYAWMVGRRNNNVNASPPDFGVYPQKCPRYHRFRVTVPGTFTFDTCGSTASLGLNLYKQTSDLAKSESRVMPKSEGRTLQDNSTKSWQGFEVPLHDNNQVYVLDTSALCFSFGPFPDVCVCARWEVATAITALVCLVAAVQSATPRRGWRTDEQLKG